jgi:hypothetical protein
MVWRLDTRDEVAYGHIVRITRLLFLKDYKGCIEGEQRTAFASLYQVIGRHGPFGYLLGLRSSARHHESRSSAQYIKDRHEHVSTHCICR